MRSWFLLAFSTALVVLSVCWLASESSLSEPSPPAAPVRARATETALVLRSDPALQVDRVDWIRGDLGTWYRDECLVVREKRLDGSLELRVNGCDDRTGAVVTFRLHPGPEGTTVVELVDQRDRTDVTHDQPEVERSCVAASGEVVLNTDDLFADKLACRYSFEGEWWVVSPSGRAEAKLEKVRTTGEFALPYRHRR